MKYRSLTKFFFKDALIVFLVYDITKRESFDEIRKYWYEQVKEGGTENVIIGIVGNKCDKVGEGVVSENEAREFATSVGAEFGLISASENSGIDDLVLRLVNKYLNVVKENGKS